MITGPCGVLGSEPPVCVQQHPDSAVKAVWQISSESGIRAKFDGERVNLSKGSETRVRFHASSPAASPLPLCARQKLFGVC